MPSFDVNKLIQTSLSLCVMILCCVLFYLIAPHLRLTRHITNPTEIAAKIISTTSSDIAIIWDLDLAMNKHNPLGFASRTINDDDGLKKFMDETKDMALTATLDAFELHSLLSAEPICSRSSSLSLKISEITKQFFVSNPNSYFCIIPIQDLSGAVSGQVSLIWKNKPSSDSLVGAVAQTRNLVKTS